MIPESVKKYIAAVKAGKDCKPTYIFKDSVSQECIEEVLKRADKQKKLITKMINDK
jgi:hypothetical protein